MIVETFRNGETLSVISCQEFFSGYGHYKIEVKLFYAGRTKTLKRVTNDLETIDAAKEAGIESWDDKTQILYNAIKTSIEDIVSEWIKEVENEKILKK